MARLHPLRVVWIFVAGWMVLGVGLSTMTLLALVTLRIGSDRWFPPTVRALARVLLAIIGVRVEIRSGAERLAGRRARIVTINHSSQLDLFVIGSLMPSAVTVVVKREFLFVPFMGLAMFAFNFVMIDRKDRERAKRSMQGAAERINKRAASVIIAPEGTRSSTGELGPFKMGAFHLALATKAPIVPIVLRGCSKLQPLGRWIPARGVVTVDILPEIATDDWDEEGLKARRDELREVYVDALEGRPGESDQRAG